MLIEGPKQTSITLKFLRHKTIVCGVRTGIKAEAKWLFPIFQQVSRSVGIQRYLVSILANNIIANYPDTILECKSLKTFFDICFSATQQYVFPTGGKQEQPYCEQAQQIVSLI